MADSTVVTKRLLGKQDINWDVTGEGATANFTNSSGVEMPLNKVNASHVPLTVAARAALSGAENVEEGLSKLKNTLDNFTDVQLMTQDTVIEIEASASPSDIQVLINQQIKNLGGHVLSFVFPAAINQQLVNTLVFTGFTNGTLLLNGNEITVADNADIDCLFKFIDCLSKVEIRNFTFQHLNSQYAIRAERCTGIYFYDCEFSGQPSGGTYAGNFICSGHLFNACTFTNDSEQESSGFGSSTSIDEILAYC